MDAIKHNGVQFYKTPLSLIQTSRCFVDPPHSGARTCVVLDFNHAIALGTPLSLIQTSRCFVDPPRSGARTCVVLDFKHAIVLATPLSLF